jgi:hypothetical protein
LDLSHRRIVGSKPLRGIAYQGLKYFRFDYRSHEVLGVEGSCKHVSCPLGGDRVVDRWHNTSAQRKVEMGDRWWTQVAWEGVKPLLTYHVSGIRNEGARGLNSQTHEVASCEGRYS